MAGEIDLVSLLPSRGWRRSPCARRFVTILATAAILGLVECGSALASDGTDPALPVTGAAAAALSDVPTVSVPTVRVDVPVPAAPAAADAPDAAIAPAVADSASAASPEDTAAAPAQPQGADASGADASGADASSAVVGAETSNDSAVASGHDPALATVADETSDDQSPVVAVVADGSGNTDVSVRVGSPGEDGNVAQTGSGSGVVSGTPDPGITPDSAPTPTGSPSAGSGAGASNVNVSVRVDSAGDNGPVSQANGTAGGAPAGGPSQSDGANVNVSIRAGSPGDIGSVSQGNDVGGSSAVGDASFSDGANVNVSVRIESPGDNGPLDQSNGQVAAGAETDATSADPAAPDAGGTPAELDPGAASDTTQYHGDNSQYHSDDDITGASWNLVWVLTLDCGDIATSNLEETGDETAANWVWDWSWNWTCGDAAADSGSAGDSGSRSPTPSAPTGASDTASETSSAGEQTTAPPTAGDASGAGWSWAWTFSICGTQASFGAPPPSAAPETWIWDWTWNWTCSDSGDAEDTTNAPSGDLPTVPTSSEDPSGVSSRAAPPVSASAPGVDVSNVSQSSSVSMNENGTEQSVVSVLFGGVSFGSPTSPVPPAPAESRAPSTPIVPSLVPPIGVAIHVTVPGVLVSPGPQVTIPPDLSSLVGIVPGLVAGSVPPPAASSEGQPAKGAELAPDAAPRNAAGARADRYPSTAATGTTQPAAAGQSRATDHEHGERAGKSHAGSGLRTASWPRLPLDPPGAPLPVGSSISWTGGSTPSVGVVGVATLVGFLVLAAPGLGRRIRLARELSPHSRDRSRIDRPG